jgi:nitric oxide reductase subunit B
VLFIAGGCLPFLWIAFQGLRHFRSGTTSLELGSDPLFTEQQPVSTGATDK